MAAITWRNVEGENLARNAVPLMAAQQSFNTAFDTVDKAFAERKQNQKEFNTNAFQEYLSGFRTPEALQAAIESGEVDQRRQQFGQLLDQAAARRAGEERLATMQQQHIANATFQNTATDLRQDPLHRQVLALQQQGKYAEADALARESNLRRMDEVAKAGAEARRTQETHNRQGESHELHIDTGRFNLNSAKDQKAQKDALEAARRGIMAVANDMGREVALGYAKPEEATAALNQAIQKYGAAVGYDNAVKFADDANAVLLAPYSERGVDALASQAEEQDRLTEAALELENSIAAVGSREAVLNQDTLADFVDKFVENPTERKQAQTMVAKLSQKGYKTPEGKTISYPQEVLKAAVLRSKEGWLGWLGPGNYRDWSIENIANELMKDTRVMDSIIKRGEREEASKTANVDALKRKLEKARSHQ